MAAPGPMVHRRTDSESEEDGSEDRRNETRHARVSDESSHDLLAQNKHEQKKKRKRRHRCHRSEKRSKERDNSDRNKRHKSKKPRKDKRDSRSSLTGSDPLHAGPPREDLALDDADFDLFESAELEDIPESQRDVVEENDPLLAQEIVATPERPNVARAVGNPLQVNGDANPGNVNNNNAPPVRLIGRNEFNVDVHVDIAYVTANIGARASRFTSEQLQEMVRETISLRNHVMDHMKIQVERRMVAVAEDEPDVKDPTIKGLQKMWEAMDPKKRSDMKKKGGAFWNIIMPGSTKKWPRRWDIDEEDLYMAKFGYQYRKEGTKLDDMKGCIARAAGRALQNARKRLFFKSKGEGGHGMIVSGNAVRISGSGKSINRNRRLDYEFKDSYVRSSKKVEDSDSDTESSSSLDSDSSDESESEERRHGRKEECANGRSNNNKTVRCIIGDYIR